ncbi:phage tail protein [Deinococcus arenicola]|uniref:Phage tail protein n=1 Tax=Deinococcus arenicola TaxID=2994950 RepID=A0ABU4DV88_9DEIO|nr:phage tail protein [Deinococcus sp. ZS9-10]MDV6376360.1 phage tail protein [Deinococcus sp. ZS9-10]
MNYQEYALSLAPRWLSNYSTEIAATAAPLDDLTLRARTLMLARLVQYAPEDVLMTIGAERRIRRFPDEPTDTYRRRVEAAWRWWRLAGTLPGMVELLRLAGYAASVTEHFTDPDQVHWAEFSVAVTPIREPIKDSFWGAGTWGGGGSWGYRLDAVPLSSLVELVDEIKPAHARLRRLTYSLGGHAWGGGSRWGNTSVAAQGHPWGSPWGEPSVIFGRTGRAESTWGEGRERVLHDINSQEG